ncbi:adenylate/guanylate cyclase domain-containing protein [Rhodobacteraceae bacterium RKSG542]|uniref:adenylate/guanylate cyclase domain-containing protein n=1 Tax=Pseudovibrio flavus TaxID=2529854 RepID=UPI0012BCE39C|nr:adenylate/guanylate cyclase domain-containing protein [Pseudovibrio flavus]MTI16885.1 adenylate/guanylate cyclase domain-containing protein [Pseudovibrio flavus]
MSIQSSAYPARSEWVRLLRLVSGLILFTFALTHFLNHAAGNISVVLMQHLQDWRYLVWHSAIGGALLYGAFVVHFVLSLWKVARRRTFAMPFWEGMQLTLGLAIPFFLIPHILHTRGAEMIFGTYVDYYHELTVLWPDNFWTQTILISIVWVHGCLGIHFWLRRHAWYQDLKPYLLLLAVVVPVLATTGWTQAARHLYLTGDTIDNYKPGEREIIGMLAQWGRLGMLGILVALFLLIVSRKFVAKLQRKIAVSYPGGSTVRVAPGQTLLEISRANKLPMMSVCGGKARCSTCRTLILSSAQPLPEPSEAEAKVLSKIRAAKGVRLACQLRPQANLSVFPLLSTKDMFTAKRPVIDAYQWGVETSVAVMFIDLRDFTKISEHRYPYDVVFLLNRYLKGMAKVVVEHGGLIDKVMGDGIMVLFGVETDDASGYLGALKVIGEAQKELERINADLANQLDIPLRIGIGLHAGQVIVGRIGLDYGNAMESGLTALGDTVNVASRLEAATKEFSVTAIVSNKLLRSVGIEATKIGEQTTIDIRGRARPLAVTLLQDSLLLDEQLLILHEKRRS